MKKKKIDAAFKNHAKKVINIFIFFIDQLSSFNKKPSDAIIISGFWRSGTTFFFELIQKLTNGKVVSEPFEFRFKPSRKYHLKKNFMTSNGNYITEMYPYIPINSKDLNLLIFIEKLTKGSIGDYKTHRRKPLKNSFKSPVIVKFVRANLAIGAIQNHFACKTIFILRHPAAIVASILRGEGMRYFLTIDYFKDIFTLQSHLMKDYLHHYSHLLSKDNYNPIEYITLYWCITNIVPLLQIQTNNFNPYIIYYEEFMLNQNSSIQDLVRYLETDKNNSHNIDMFENSSTTRSNRINSSLHDRIFGWKNELQPDQISMIYNICALFGKPITDVLSRIDRLTENSKELIRCD